MKKVLVSGEVHQNWNADALYAKSRRYVEQLLDVDRDEWQRALWASLSLELLARSALANVSPALLADTASGWSSLFHALGFQPKEEKFSPKSISTNEVLKRLLAIVPGFTKEHEAFCIRFAGLRNMELHTGELAFDGMKDSSWQPWYYLTCQVLLASLGLLTCH